MKLPFKFILGMLVLAALACTAPAYQNVSGPQAPPDVPQSSDEALQSFNSKWRELNLATPNGPFNVTFTEAELTSAMSEVLDEAKADGLESIPISDVQVDLRDGYMYVYGQLEVDLIEVNGLVTVLPTLGDDGWVDLEIISFDFGALEVDPELLAELTSSAEQSLNAQIQASQLDIDLTGVYISDESLMLSGTINP